MLLYLCSSSFIAPYEVGFVRQWAAAIRASNDARLRDAALLVRPHPQNAEQWRDVDLGAEFGQAAVWPRQGVNPIGGAARSDYFDSMYHADAVVGVNTSGMIESGIIGRPVYAVQVEEFAATQDGTLHFQHLKNVDGGLLHLSSTLDEHIAQLERLPSEAEAGRQKARRFIQAFVRPRGLEHAATPFVVAEIEQYAAAAALVPDSARASRPVGPCGARAAGLRAHLRRDRPGEAPGHPAALDAAGPADAAGLVVARRLRDASAAARAPARGDAGAPGRSTWSWSGRSGCWCERVKLLVHNWLARRKGEPGQAA